MIICIIIGAVLLVAASYHDIRTLEVPLRYPILANIFPFGYMIIEGSDLLFIEHIISAALIFIFLFLFSWFGNLGGADCLIGEVIGLYLGLNGLYAVLIGIICSLPQVTYKAIRKNRKPYPFVPYLTAGYISVAILSIIGTM